MPRIYENEFLDFVISGEQESASLAVFVHGDNQVAVLVASKSDKDWGHLCIEAHIHKYISFIESRFNPTQIFLYRPYDNIVRRYLSADEAPIEANVNAISKLIGEEFTGEFVSEWANDIQF